MNTVLNYCAIVLAAAMGVAMWSWLLNSVCQ